MILGLPHEKRGLASMSAPVPNAKTRCRRACGGAVARGASRGGSPRRLNKGGTAHGEGARAGWARGDRVHGGLLCSGAGGTSLLRVLPSANTALRRDLEQVRGRARTPVPPSGLRPTQITSLSVQERERGALARPAGPAARVRKSA